MSKKIRVYADVVADLFHRGHVEFLKKVKSLYDNTYVIVGIQSNEDSQKYKRVPIFNAEDRAEIIKSCKDVDEIILEPQLYITKEFLKENNIDIVVHGDDMTEYLKKYNYEIPIKLEIMRTVPYYEGISTTQIIQKIFSLKKEIKKRGIR